jgi:hypothetical protein
MTFANPSLMPHQAEAVKKLRNGNILKGGVGSGKTRAALAYYATLAPWIKLYVITTAMKRDSLDWEDEAKLWGCEVVVDSWNNLPNYEEVEGAFFIFDEQRVVGSGVWVKAFLEVARKNEWILLSATPGDTWLDYIPVFIANGFYKNRTEFVREHVVYSRFTKYPKVERILGTRSLSLYLREILVEMPYTRHTTRHTVNVFTNYDRGSFEVVWKRCWNSQEECPIRSVAELFILGRRIINSDPSRLERIKDLLIEHPKLIIFYNFDYELEILRRLKVKQAEWNGHKHEEIPDGEEWVYLVQYTAGAEGWNCVVTDAMVFYSATYSYRAFEQAKGRIDRLNTPFTDLRYYLLRSSCVIDVMIYRTLEDKKNFNERSALKTVI